MKSQPTRLIRRKAKSASLKDPKGGLTSAGRRSFNQKEGSNLKAGVRGKEDTPEKMRRKGSFLRRHFANPQGPMLDQNGKPTRLALSAHAWGEPVPKNARAVKRLASKGAALFKQYSINKTGSESERGDGMVGKKKNSLVNNINKKKKAGTSKPKSKSSVSKRAYSEMEKGYGRKKSK